MKTRTISLICSAILVSNANAELLHKSDYGFIIENKETVPVGKDTV